MKLQLPSPNGGQGAAPQQAADDGWSARGYIRFGIICVILLAGGLGGWSATAKLKGAVIASGQLRVEAQRQVVQHLDGGIVGDIFVRNGDVVDAGQVLIRLDDTALRSELTVLESQLFEIMARRDRLLAEQAELEQIAFRELLAKASAERSQIKTLMQGQQKLFDARRETIKREMEVMGERKLQLGEQVVGAESELEALQDQIALIDQELVGMRRLQQQGLAQINRVLSLEREAARLKGQAGQNAAQIAQLNGQISELDIEILRSQDARREENITEERELGYRELELTERRIALLEQLSRLDIRAPRPGVVHEMTVFALKSVIRPAEPVLFIVPSDTGMVIDAQVDPLNRDQVHVTQDVVLRFSAFNSRTTPEVFGRVRKIASDTVVNEESGLTFFPTEVVLNDGEIEKLEGNELVAGMPVEVYIQTGERTPFNYLMRPITDYFSRALRED